MCPSSLVWRGRVRVSGQLEFGLSTKIYVGISLLVEAFLDSNDRIPHILSHTRVTIKAIIKLIYTPKILDKDTYFYMGWIPVRMKVTVRRVRTDLHPWINRN